MSSAAGIDRRSITEIETGDTFIMGLDPLTGEVNIEIISDSYFVLILLND